MVKIHDILAWDEAREDNGVPDMYNFDKLRMFDVRERQLLEALAGGEWVPEGVLRKVLGLEWLVFFKVSTKLVLVGMIRARSVGSLFESEYRLGFGGRDDSM